NPKQQVHGILIFLNHTKEATHSRWISQSELPHWLNLIYLDDFLPDLLDQKPDDPFIAVFAPLILKQTELEQQAPKLWHTIHTAEIPDAIRSNLQQILELWFFEKFKEKDEQEVLTMLQTLTPLEETLAYRNIFAKGKIAGEMLGISKGKAEGETLMLKKQILRKFKTLPKWAEQQIDKANSKQLENWAENIFDAETLKQLLSD
ncbi:hypothetical protein TI05_14395, partial [Achromatium sp. WMS3]